MKDSQHRPHRRHNPLSDEWVLVSPQRSQRPWYGQVETNADEPLAAHDPDCHLCPGNERQGGVVNPRYTRCFVFDNDFPALASAESHEDFPADAEPLFQARSVNGLCRVLCYSERHNAGLPLLDGPGLRAVVEAWCEQYKELEHKYRWVQVFENKGAINGCSNPHPHGQVWASDTLPTLVAREDRSQKEYFQRENSILLADYAAREEAIGERVVCANEHWLVVVPWWACWPYETLLLPRRAVQRMPELTPDERAALAGIVKELTTRYDNLFQTDFPYSMGWHGAPASTQGEQYWHLHAHFYPPLLRSATVKKFMVGYELLAEAQRDLTPEQAAARLREQAAIHYRDAASE